MSWYVPIFLSRQKLGVVYCPPFKSPPKAETNQEAKDNSSTGNAKQKNKSNSGGKEKEKMELANNSSSSRRRGRPPKKPRDYTSDGDVGGGQGSDEEEGAEWGRGGVGDAFVKRRPPSARNMARMSRSNGCLVGSVNPPLTTAEAPLVIDSGEEDDVTGE